MKNCLIYDKRPDLCRNFPVCAANIKYFDKCTHKFDVDNVRSGECCACGQCCVRMPWPKLTDVNTANPEIAITRDEITGSVKLNPDCVIDPICRFLDK